MIRKKFIALFLTLISCVPALAETDLNNGPNIYVPDYRLEKIYKVPAGDIYAVRGSLRRLDNFVELWTRVIPRNSQKKTLDVWEREKIALTSSTAYAQLNFHFYCNGSEAAIPATYLFDQESQLISSRVVMLDEPFSTDDKPIIKHIKKLACGGKLDRLSDGRE